MSKTLNTALLGSLGVLGACGFGGGSDKKGGASSNTSTKTESYSYTLEENGCSTGEQKFTSFQSACDGLENDTLNNGCAYTLRKQKFKEMKCGGEFNGTSTSKLATEGEQLQAIEAFSQSFAAGKKEFNLTKAPVKVRVLNTINQQTIRNEDLKCSTTTPIVVEGKYPEVTLKMGQLDCRGGVVPDALKSLPDFLGRVVYTARHIPAGPEYLQQFALALKDMGPMGGLFDEPREGPRSMNAVLQKNSVYFDILGSMQAPSRMRFGGNHHYYSVSIGEQVAGKAKISIDATVTVSDQETFEISIDQ